MMITISSMPTYPNPLLSCCCRRTDRLAIVVDPLFLQPKLEDRDDHHRHEEHDRCRRSLAVVLTRAEALLIDVVDKRGRTVCGTALGQRLDDVECLKRRQNRGNQEEEGDGRQHWQGDGAQTPPGVCAVQLRCIVEIFWNALQTREENHRGKSEVLPDIDDD